MTRRRHTPWFEGTRRRKDQEAMSFSFVLETRRKSMGKNGKSYGDSLVLSEFWKNAFAPLHAIDKVLNGCSPQP